ncbi:MAG TPA: heme-binding protein [Polyangiaceae bacterium]|nr:heme-binding protein [Polyangiaceae bacterium]
MKASKVVVSMASGLGLAGVAGLISSCGSQARAQEDSSGCGKLPNQAVLAQVLKSVVHASTNGGSGNEMWGAVVDRTGIVCSVAFSGADAGDQYPGSRTIAAAKANTANAFSLPKTPLSSGNLYAATQPGGSIFGLENGNPVDTTVAFQGDPELFGTPSDPLVGKKIGGTIVFGGGLPLYGADGKLLGGLGVSGDSSCADHIIAWQMRYQFNMANLPAGTNDNITLGAGAHPDCGAGSTALVPALPTDYPLKLR